MMLTDAGSSMVKLGKILRERGYNKMLHVLCMAHAIHNVIGTIRKHYPNVNKVIMGVKEFFTNAHARLKKFKEIAPEGTKRPPAPILTRFGKWVDAAAYYAEGKNREALLQVLINLKSNPSDASHHRSFDEGKTWTFNLI